MVTDEMVRAAMDAFYGENRDTWPASQKRAHSIGMRRALEAALSRPKADAEPVAAKPLEWELDEPNWWTAQPSVMIGGAGYEVRITDSGKTRFRIGPYDWTDFDGTADEAKAAAQADYERRILSALASPLQPDEFKPVINFDNKAGTAELIFEDCPTITGKEMTVRPLLRMHEDKYKRTIVGFQWDIVTEEGR